MLLVYFGILIHFFGQSLHKCYPIVKRGFLYILPVHRQWLHCLLVKFFENVVDSVLCKFFMYCILDEQ